MALIKCPDCQSDVSDLAPACPKCGRPIAAKSTPVAMTPEATIRKPISLGVKIGIGMFIVLPLIVAVVAVVFVVGLLGRQIAGRSPETWQSRTLEVIRPSPEDRQRKAMEDIKDIEEALHLFKLDNGVYPSTSQGLRALVERPGGATNTPDAYLVGMPRDPWGNPYAYFGNGRDFIIKSYGADGREGGEGENADIDNRQVP